MNFEDHVAAARMFLTVADRLHEPEMSMAAAEMIWGATVQAIHAISHRAGTSRHASNNRERRRVLQRLESAHGLGRELSGGFTNVVSKLHNHFYGGILSDDELEHEMRNGIAFVNRLLGFADS